MLTWTIRFWSSKDHNRISYRERISENEQTKMKTVNTVKVKDEAFTSVFRLYSGLFVIVFECYHFSCRLLEDVDLNIDVALLAGQNFTSSNTLNTGYIKASIHLQASNFFWKNNSNKTDLKYIAKMARSIRNTEKAKSANDDETCMYRTCQDENLFFETRTKDGGLILEKSLDNMIESTSEMQKHLKSITWCWWDECTMICLWM